MDKQRERKKLAELLCRVTCEGGEDFGNCPERRNGHCRSIHRLEMCQVGAIANHILADEEIKRAFELLKVEKEGRLLETPCKVGDTVYEFDYDYEKEETYVVDTTVTGFAIITFEEIHSFRKIGKTVFLSREDAEKALEERKNN